MPPPSNGVPACVTCGSKGRTRNRNRNRNLRALTNWRNDIIQRNITKTLDARYR